MAFRDGVKVSDHVIAEMVTVEPKADEHTITVNTERGTARCSCGAEWFATNETSLDQFKCPNDK